MHFLASFGFVWVRFHVFCGLQKPGFDRAVIGFSPFFRMGSFRNFAGRTKNVHVTMFFRFVGVIMGILGISAFRSVRSWVRLFCQVLSVLGRNMQLARLGLADPFTQGLCRSLG